VESSPRAYRLKAGNAAPPISTSIGTFPRIAIRIVIALGDIAVQDGDFIGDAFALATRVEAVTPPDEIYLTGPNVIISHR